MLYIQFLNFYNKKMNHLLTWEGNWDIAYNRLINKELWEIIKDEEINEDFKKMIEEVKDLLENKDWIANLEELKQKIFEKIYHNKSRLPSCEYFYRELTWRLFRKHNHMELDSEWWEKELDENINKCINYCLDTNKFDDKIIKEIIIFEIIRQWIVFKRKNEEKLNILKKDSAEKTIHYLKIDDDTNT